MPNGNQLYGGPFDVTSADYTAVENMAYEIEQAYKAIRFANNIKDPIPSGSSANDMRMMFVAIATGVVNHLQNNPGAFAVQVQNGAFTSTGSVTEVNVL